MYIAEDYNDDEGSEDRLDKLEENIHRISDLTEESTVGDEVYLIE